MLAYYSTAPIAVWSCLARVSFVVSQAIQGGYENKEDKRERRDLNHLLGLTCKKLRAKMPTNLLYRERPELKAQEAKEAAEKAASGSATDAKETGNLQQGFLSNLFG